jgi:hypothetical protein
MLNFCISSRCLFTYIYYITIIYRSRGQNLSAHDDFMMPIMLELGVCLHTFIDHEVKMCLLMFILVFTSLTVCLHTFIDHDHEVP